MRALSPREATYSDYPGVLSYAEIHQRYAESPYGLYHATQPPRYSSAHAYDRDSMIADLGDDVHPVRHMAYTEAAIVRPLLAAQNRRGAERFNVEQIRNLRLAALLHDIGECEHPDIFKNTGFVVGDVQWQYKSDEDSLKEAVIRQYLYTRLYPDLPPDVLSAAEDIIGHPEGTLSRDAFNAAEKLGYYTTAIRAGRIALALHRRRMDEGELRFTQLRRLAIGVTNSHRQSLQERRERFPYVGRILEASALLDERIHAELGQTIP